MSIQDGKLLYHLTKKDNLESIIKYGLLPREELIQRGMVFEDVADPEILFFREEHNLNKYVPFHFFSGNPFDGKVQKKHIEKEFVYLCILRTEARKNGFKIIPRHPLNMNQFQLYSYEDGMDIIEWDKMEERCYSDSNCKEICMAECIFKGSIGINAFFSINVQTDKTKKLAEELFQKYNISKPPYINLSPNYFIGK